MSSGNSPVTQIFKADEHPENRKDIVVMYLKAVRDAAMRKNIDEEISNLIYFIISALPEIPENVEYDRGRVFSLEPSFAEAKKEYLSHVPLLVPELIYGHIPMIERWRKEAYRRRLQKEAAKIHELLKTHTHWLFDEEVRLRQGK